MNFTRTDDCNVSITLQDENDSYNCLVTSEEYIKIQNGDYELAHNIMQKEIERKNRLLAFKLLKETSAIHMGHREATCSKNLFVEKSIINQPRNEHQETLIIQEEMDLPEAEHNTDTGYTSEESYLVHAGNTMQNNELTNSQSSEPPVTPSTKIWTDRNIRILIELYKEHEKEFESSIKKIVWKKVAVELSKQSGINITWSQCDTKFKGLKEYYKTVKKHNNTSGNNYKFWIYYDLLDEFLSKKPEIIASFTCSSAKGLIDANKQTINEIRTINESDAHTESDGNVSEVAASSAFESLHVRKRKREENAMERRHRDKMTRQDKHLSLMERLVVCLEQKKD